MIAGHDEMCDVLQLAPDGGPSQKPCNHAYPVDNHHKDDGYLT